MRVSMSVCVSGDKSKVYSARLNFAHSVLVTAEITVERKTITHASSIQTDKLNCIALFIRTGFASRRHKCFVCLCCAWNTKINFRSSHIEFIHRKLCLYTIAAYISIVNHFDYFRSYLFIIISIYNSWMTMRHIHLDSFSFFLRSRLRRNIQCSVRNWFFFFFK